MELIDRKSAINAVLGLKNCYNGFSDTYDKSCIVGLLEELPKVDAEPVRHGRWLDGNRGKYDGTLYWYRYCSECLYERHDDNVDKDTPYCPDCGAKMDGGGDNETD